jgi:hypothetical protein
LVTPLVVPEVGPPARSSNQGFRFDPDNVFTKSAPEPIQLSAVTPGRFGVELRWVDADAPVSFPYQGADVG